MDLRLFFSWQEDSDSRKLEQKKFIKQCIEEAIARVNKELRYVNIIFQEGVRGVSGSPELIPEIEERIKQCHIFIGDYTFINQENFLSKFIKKMFHVKYKITPNPNVVNEASRFAARPYMQYQGFQVMNTRFGDPNEDVRLMFVDNRGKRFPITFKLDEYNDKVPEERYINEKKSFTRALEIAIKECAEKAVFHIDEDIKPFVNWESQYKTTGFDSGYITKGLESYLNQIRDNKDNLRISGLSGLGKTRMVLEAFRDDSIKYLYAYIDCQSNAEDLIISKLPFMFQFYKEMVLVFDNCNLGLNDKIIKIKRENHALNRIITIYNDPDERSSFYSTPLKLQKDFDEVVEKILERFSKFYKPIDKEKLLAFAGGIPMMAQLLVEGLRNGEPLGVVNDAILMNKILDIDEKSQDRKIIRSISLFDFIGFEGNLHKEIEFVAGTKAITSIDMDSKVLEQEFDRVVNKYIKRKIIERKGRLVGVRPTPIALYLISEWIEECSDKRLLEVIQAIQESEIAKPLTDSFADQFRYMGHNPKARKMLNQLLGENSPFGNAEVINTDLGSRLFRSFVEVNPEAVAKCLWSIIGSMDINSLRKIEAGRRNLVWTIEKICFDPVTFERGAEMLLLLGMAENEQIGNNATSQFSSLFPVILPATASSLKQRLLFLETQSHIKDRHPLLMNALGRALRTRDFIYWGGAEQRGTENLNNYYPKTKSEISEYINGCLNILKGIVKENSSQLERCCVILEQNVGCLCESGFGDLVIPLVQMVADLKDNEWEGMMDSLRLLLVHNKIQLTNELRSEIEALIKKLEKDDFFFRFTHVEKKNKWILHQYSYDEAININNKEYEELAKELASDKTLYNVDALKKIYSFNGLYGDIFGSTIAKQFSKQEQLVFIQNTLEVFHSLANYYISIFVSFIREVEEDVFDFAFNKMRSLEKKGVLFACVATRNYKIDDYYPEELFSMVKDNRASVEDYELFRNYMSLKYYNVDDFILLFKHILVLPNSFKCVIHMSMVLFWGHTKEDKRKALVFLSDEISKRLDEIEYFSKNDDFWLIVKESLKEEVKTGFAKEVMRGLLKLMKKSTFIPHYNIDECIGILVNEYFDEIWSDLSQALVGEGENVSQYYHLRSILCSTTATDNGVGVLFQADHSQALFDLCRIYPFVAPSRIMEMTPLFEGDSLSPIVMYLLDNYGNQQSVLDALTGNMCSFSFVGSIVPLYEKQYKCITPLLSHNIEAVRNWAVKMQKYLDKEISDERNWDAEGLR